MSKNYNNEAKIKKMAEKYRKFKLKQQQSIPRSDVCQFIDKTYHLCQTLWLKIIPLSIRDYHTEFQMFDYYWKKETSKLCSNEIISRFSLEQNLQNYSIGKPLVIGLTYYPQSMKKIVAFVNQIRVEDIKKEIIFCPINLQGRKYKTEIERKVVLLDEMVVTFWRGLFNEIILLNKYVIQQPNLFKNIIAETNERISYQNKIRDTASSNLELTESKSEVLM